MHNHVQMSSWLLCTFGYHRSEARDERRVDLAPVYLQMLKCDAQVSQQSRTGLPTLLEKGRWELMMTVL